MIVCKQCGHHNDDDDGFCGSCGGFLEFVGERAEPEDPPTPAPSPAPSPAADADAAKVGLATRIKRAVTGDDEPPSSAADAASPSPLARPSSPAGPPRPHATSPPPTASAPSSSAAPPAEGSATAPPDGSDEAARRRAAALVARTPAPAAVSAPGPRAPVQPAPAPASEPARQPAAQRPGVAPERPRPAAREAASRPPQPGDVTCSACGEGNDAERRFCRRCGTALVAAPVAAQVPWWRRLFTRRPAEAMPAGARPMRAAGGDRSRRAGRAARRAGGGLLGGYAGLRRIVALLAVVGIGVGFALPSVRTTVADGVSDGIARVRRLVKPEYEKVNPAEGGVAANVATAEHPASFLVDGARNTFWSAPGGAQGATIAIVFAEPTDIDRLGITPGAQDPGQPDLFLSQPRPRDLLVALVGDDGQPVTRQITVDDDPGFQTFGIERDDVRQVQIVVQSCYPSPQGGQECSIAELELFRKR